MARNLLVNGVTYNNVEALEMTDTNGEKVLYTEGGTGGGSGGEDPNALLSAALDGSLTTIDSDVKSVIGHACRGLTKLKTVNLPNATSIGTYAFYTCSALTSISAPKVTSLGTYAFYKTALKRVNFPLATSAPQNSFYDIVGLEIADFGAIRSIGQAAFAYADVLKALIIRKTDSICTLGTAASSFQNSTIATGTGYVYVPAALLDTYKTATNWSNYASQFRALEDYTVDGTITGAIDETKI